MTTRRFKLTQAAIDAEPVIDEWGDDEEDLAVGYSMMRQLAESDETLIEVEPGVWRQSGGGSGPGNSGPGW
jgi:hypothetical protein